MTQLTSIVSSTDNIFGNHGAPIEFVEYGDNECPYCGQAYPIVKDIKTQLGNDIKFVFRNFSLNKIHLHAFPVAVATEAAAFCVLILFAVINKIKEVRANYAAKKADSYAEIT